MVKPLIALKIQNSALATLVAVSAIPVQAIKAMTDQMETRVEAQKMVAPLMVVHTAAEKTAVRTVTLTEILTATQMVATTVIPMAVHTAVEKTAVRTVTPTEIRMATQMVATMVIPMAVIMGIPMVTQMGIPTAILTVDL